jgi:AcrR family transcriptional regulator
MKSMPRRPKTAPRRPPQQRRSAETVEVLLQAAERVLARDGFARATTNRIAEEAGVSIGTLYHYYPTLEALIEALVHRMWREELAIIEARAPSLATLSVAEGVATLVAALAARVHERRALYQRWYAEAPHLGDLATGLALSDRATSLTLAFLEARRDQLRVEATPFVADFVVKMVLAAVRTAARDFPEQLASGELARAVTDLVVRYLCR